MKLFLQVITGFRSELMEIFAKIVKKETSFTIFAKTFILNVSQVSEYDSELASKVKQACLSFKPI